MDYPYVGLFQLVRRLRGSGDAVESYFDRCGARQWASYLGRYPSRERALVAVYTVFVCSVFIASLSGVGDVICSCLRNLDSVWCADKEGYACSKAFESFVLACKLVSTVEVFVLSIHWFEYLILELILVNNYRRLASLRNGKITMPEMDFYKRSSQMMFSAVKGTPCGAFVYMDSTGSTQAMIPLKRLPGGLVVPEIPDGVSQEIACVFPGYNSLKESSNPEKTAKPFLCGTLPFGYLFNEVGEALGAFTRLGDCIVTTRHNLSHYENGDAGKVFARGFVKGRITPKTPYVDVTKIITHAKVCLKAENAEDLAIFLADGPTWDRLGVAKANVAKAVRNNLPIWSYHFDFTRKEDGVHVQVLRSSCEVVPGARVATRFHNGDTARGDCGAPLLVRNDRRWQIVGIHKEGSWDKTNIRNGYTPAILVAHFIMVWRKLHRLGQDYTIDYEVAAPLEVERPQKESPITGERVDDKYERSERYSIEDYVDDYYFGNNQYESIGYGDSYRGNDEYDYDDDEYDPRSTFASSYVVDDRGEEEILTLRAEERIRKRGHIVWQDMDVSQKKKAFGQGSVNWADYDSDDEFDKEGPSDDRSEPTNEVEETPPEEGEIAESREDPLRALYPPQSVLTLETQQRYDELISRTWGNPSIDELRPPSDPPVLRRSEQVPAKEGPFQTVVPTLAAQNRERIGGKPASRKVEVEPETVERVLESLEEEEIEPVRHQFAQYTLDGISYLWYGDHGEFDEIAVVDYNSQVPTRFGDIVPESYTAKLPWEETWNDDIQPFYIKDWKTVVWSLLFHLELMSRGLIDYQEPVDMIKSMWTGNDEEGKRACFINPGDLASISRFILSIKKHNKHWNAFADEVFDNHPELKENFKKLRKHMLLKEGPKPEPRKGRVGSKSSSAEKPQVTPQVGVPAGEGRKSPAKGKSKQKQVEVIPPGPKEDTGLKAKKSRRNRSKKKSATWSNPSVDLLPTIKEGPCRVDLKDFQQPPC